MGRLKFLLGGILLGLFIFVAAISISITISKGQRKIKIQESRFAETQTERLARTEAIPQIKKEIPPEIKADKFKLAGFYRSEGDIEKAISTLQELIKEIKNPCSELAMLSECYIDKKQYELAEETLKRAIEIGPDNPYTHRVEAALYIELGKYEEALKHIKEALKFARKSSDEAYAYFQLANLQHAQNDIDAAIKSLKKAIELLPENVHFKGRLNELELESK